MIVNVNPYDTGYDENSHVMKFAALAREVYITPAPAPVHRVPTTMVGKTHGAKGKELGPLTLKDPDIVPMPYRRKVTISMGGPGSGKKPVEATLEVLEGTFFWVNQMSTHKLNVSAEDEPNEESDDDSTDDYPINPLVDSLFDEVESLRMQVSPSSIL
jgi:kinesin family protein 20